MVLKMMRLKVQLLGRDQKSAKQKIQKALIQEYSGNYPDKPQISLDLSKAVGVSGYKSCCGSCWIEGRSKVSQPSQVQWFL